jgi:hypothetical protein
MAHTSGRAFFFIPAYQFVPFLATRSFPTMEVIVMMDVSGVIDPTPIPSMVGDPYLVPVPIEASGAPSPRTKRDP